MSITNGGLELDLGLEPPPTVEELSPGAKLTGRRREAIARGEHPVTHVALIRVSSPDDTRTCGDCNHRYIKHSGGFTGSKCDLGGRQQGQQGYGPDVVQRWPACILWVARP